MRDFWILVSTFRWSAAALLCKKWLDFSQIGVKIDANEAKNEEKSDFFWQFEFDLTHKMIWGILGAGEK